VTRVCLTVCLFLPAFLGLPFRRPAGASLRLSRERPLAGRLGPLDSALFPLRHALAQPRQRPARHFVVAERVARVEQARVGGGGAEERSADLVFALEGCPQVCARTLPNVEGQLNLMVHR